MNDLAKYREREEELRKLALAEGFMIVKSKEKNPRMPSFGRWAIFGPSGLPVMIEVERSRDKDPRDPAAFHCFTLDEVEKFIKTGLNYI